MMLTDFFHSLSNLNNNPPTSLSIWGLGEDFPVNLENGKFMLPLLIKKNLPFSKLTGQSSPRPQIDGGVGGL